MHLTQASEKRLLKACAAARKLGKREKLAELQGELSYRRNLATKERIAQAMLNGASFDGNYLRAIYEKGGK